MDKTALEEKLKYDVIWRQYPSYRECSPGEIFAPFFFDGFKHLFKEGQTLIDFGCGTARVAKDFMANGLNPTLVDISPYCLDEEIRHMLPLFLNRIQFVQACLWQLPQKLQAADWIYCCDVLEHIPEKYVDQVLSGMEERMKMGGYLSICLKEDLSGKKMGSTLHLTVRNKPWWEEKISKHFNIIREDAFSNDDYFNTLINKKGA